MSPLRIHRLGLHQRLPRDGLPHQLRLPMDRRWPRLADPATPWPGL